MHFWQLLFGFSANVAESSSHSRKTVNKLKKFIEKTVHSKNSFEHIKCSFDEPFESSYRTRKTFSLNFHRKPWIFSDDKNNLTQSFSLTQHFLTKVLEFFWSVLKKMQKFFLQNSNFPKKIFVLINCSFDKIFEDFAPKCQNVLLTARRRWKYSKIS